MNFAFNETATTKRLYAEVKEGNRTYFECSICFRKLSRLQRIESHLKLVHGKGESNNLKFASACRWRHVKDVKCPTSDVADMEMQTLIILRL